MTQTNDEPTHILCSATKVLGTAFKKIGTISSLGMENTYANQCRDAAMARYKYVPGYAPCYLF